MPFMSNEEAEHLKDRVESLEWSAGRDGYPVVRVQDLFVEIDFMTYDFLFCYRETPTA